MKSTFVQLCFIVLMISSLHAIKLTRSSSIKGVVMQDNKIKKIWAVQGTDSTEVTSKDGAFNIKVRPGIWKIIIDLNDAYRQTKVFDNIQTREGKNIDLGKIDLD